MMNKYNNTLILTVWTVLVVASAVWNSYDDRQHTIEKARVEARTLFDVNLVYRQWVADRGGIYAPVTDTFGPNKYLVTEERDVTTTRGQKLTLVNGAWMTRMIFEMLAVTSPFSPRNRITAIDYLNPVNKPDAWELEALQAFEKGEKERSAISNINGKAYMRLMKPMYVDEGCLKCHGHQGYAVGEVRGGIGMAVPMEPYYKIIAQETRAIVLAHFSLWLVGSLGIVLLTGRLRKHQEKVAESEWKFRTLSDSAREWEYWINEKSDVLYMSPSSLEITGYTPEEFARNPELLTGIIHPDDRDNFKNHIKEFEAPSHDEMEFRIVTKEGKTRWISHLCGPIYREGVFLGRRASNRDITERKRLEEQVMHSQKMESVGLLAGGIAHDFNNILTAIIGYAEIAMMRLPKDHPQREQLSIIKASGERAANLTRQLLAFSRKQILEMKVTSLNDLINNMAKMLHRVIREDIHLELRTRALTDTILADPGQIEQVLLNLVVNARDAMPSGGDIIIETSGVTLDDEYVKTRREVEAGEYILLSISDTGRGIPAELTDKIFEPFFTTKEIGKGTGLGLATVYGIVKQHKGFIYVYSEVGIGTTFKIYLPTVKTSQKQHLHEEAQGLQRGSETVLVVDDEPLIRNLVADTLRPLGYTVLEASSGEEALAISTTHVGKIDVLFTDVVMRGMNGRELRDQFLRTHPDSAVIFMSGYTDNAIVHHGVLEEGVVLLQKPLDTRQLTARLREVIDRQRS